MRDVPYVEPSNDFFLNVGTILVVLETLSSTARGKQVLNFEKLQIFFYLISRPTVLNNILRIENKKTVELRADEEFSINSVSTNIDPLFDRNKLKLIVQYLAARELIKISYKKGEGFLFELNERGESLSSKFHADYYSDLRRYALNLRFLQSTSASRLNNHLNTLLRKET